MAVEITSRDHIDLTNDHQNDEIIQASNQIRLNKSSISSSSLNSSDPIDLTIDSSRIFDSFIVKIGNITLTSHPTNLIENQNNPIIPITIDDDDDDQKSDYTNHQDESNSNFDENSLSTINSMPSMPKSQFKWNPSSYPSSSSVEDIECELCYISLISNSDEIAQRHCSASCILNHRICNLCYKEWLRRIIKNDLRPSCPACANDLEHSEIQNGLGYEYDRLIFQKFTQ